MNIEHIKSALCEGFCDGIAISEANNIINLSTPFEIAGGDPVGFYLVPDSDGNYHIEDDGSIIPFMVASGVNVFEGARKAEFEHILASSGVLYNEHTGELYTDAVGEGQLAHATMRFINALLKLDALRAPLKPESVAAMFKEDARNKIQESFNGIATVKFDEPLTPELSDFMPDAIIQKDDNKPTAVYFLTTDQKAWESIALRYKAINEENIECSVVGLIDRSKSRLITSRSIASVSNNLDANPYFYDSQVSSMERIGREVGVETRKMH